MLDTGELVSNTVDGVDVVSMDADDLRPTVIDDVIEVIIL